MKKGLLLINLGTPRTPAFRDVWRFLREFLMDKRVISLPLLVRYLLVYGFILPFRTKNSAKAYHKIWQEQGSPLRTISESLAEQLQLQLGKDWKVVLSMRYGEPSLKQGLLELEPCDKLVILPLYPQYAASSTGTALEKVFKLLSQKASHPSIVLIKDFYNDSGYIDALATLIAPHLSDHDFVLFSYHGIPESHLASSCQPVCHHRCPPISLKNQNCYRAQCQVTTEALALKLDLEKDHYGFSFQSRLGKTPWIGPYTDDYLIKLAHLGIKRLLITCPSFVTDCLETLEEIGIRANEQWQKLGGEKLTLVPALNTSELWVKHLVEVANSSFYAIDNK